MFGLSGAGDRFRTDDLVLGKHALYQLSYTRSVKPPERILFTIRRVAACQITARLTAGATGFRCNTFTTRT
jgi:hypothetical protein